VGGSRYERRYRVEILISWRVCGPRNERAAEQSRSLPSRVTKSAKPVPLLRFVGQIELDVVLDAIEVATD
jgi:hypothetical protein